MSKGNKHGGRADKSTRGQTHTESDRHYMTYKTGSEVQNPNAKAFCSMKDKKTGAKTSVTFMKDGSQKVSRKKGKSGKSFLGSLLGLD